ncbi:mechanosensitive ion channel family protein [Mesorhizobium sp. DCY119]|uniref:mechanosensitive ion channel family protein n=1 Tax=Mesorhizobium sp. DCY119 TaxID=2108445 RepID=UPI000E7521F5|nr:mechanosensitive ion channel family protein [Mesorhizobium sp. DCY119]RJG40616.1 mechanosensitive ion channel family protein [Mesorhizobium sp. DCY119]
MSEDEIDGGIGTLEALSGQIARQTAERLARWKAAPNEWADFLNSLGANGTNIWIAVLQIILVAIVVITVFLTIERWLAARPGTKSLAGAIFRALLGMAVSTIVGLLAAQSLQSPGVLLRVLRIAALYIGLGCCACAFARILLSAHAGAGPSTRSPRVNRFIFWICVSITWVVGGLTLDAALRLFGADPALADFFITVAVALPGFALFIFAVVRNRRTLSGLVGSSHPRSPIRAYCARLWPASLTAFLLMIFISVEIGVTLGRHLPGAAVLVTVLIVVASPHLDAALRRWAEVSLKQAEISVWRNALRRTIRFVTLIILAAILLTVWLIPIAASISVDLKVIATTGIGLSAIALFTAFIWNLISVITVRTLSVEESASINGLAAVTGSSTRLGTLVPLIAIVGKSALVSLAILSALVSVGINVWPIITGMSIFGLAIGFGSQTLVKDIVSGLFFLIDDAFRYGEYIETSGAKGTVEKISVRSLSLRSPRGALATVPYGSIGKILNFSRDWAVEKLVFRVSLDTDIELVQKLFKKIGQEIAANPEYAADLIEPFKSQGIGELEDGTLVIGGKFKARAGSQSAMRRDILLAVHRAFRENGIQSVAKPLTGELVA